MELNVVLAVILCVFIAVSVDIYQQKQRKKSQ